ncbi:MAG TPA: protein-L-isoaspartate(D-aspartate) O-methyltransferase [Candidatus Binatia bacterium]|nr:protein-L-isoaspartate(D-aspartate) O-methyltransferase [Candidatus Binatia bacterium]
MKNHNAVGIALLFFFIVLVCSPIRSSQVQSEAIGQEDSFSRARRTMVERDLRGRGIKDRRVLETMGTVPRHVFVPKKLRAAAYEDRPLPIGNGQTISQPYIVAFMTEVLEVKGTEKLLEIGTGSGYQTAVLARLAKEVFSIEIVPSLSESAKKVLEQLGFANIELRVGDGFFGWEEKSPFDAILVTAAAVKIPEPLWRQLREGGRLVMPLGDEGQTQRLVRVRKISGKQIVEDFTGVLFVPLTGAVQKQNR